MMTDKEFADYHSRYSNDPIVQKLCYMVLGGTVAESMQNEIEELTDDLEYLQRDLEDARSRIVYLEARTASELVKELEESCLRNKNLLTKEREASVKLTKEKELLQNKIDVWHVMER